MAYDKIVVIGAARSGTNMIRDLLCQFEGVHTWDCDEINPIWKHGNRAHNNDELTAEHATPSVIRFIRAAFDKEASRRPDTRILVEKTCANSVRLEFVDKVLPDARYVWMVRDPRDVVSSSVKKWNGGSSLGYLLKKIRFIPWPDLPYFFYEFGLKRLRQKFDKGYIEKWGVQVDELQTAPGTEQQHIACSHQWKKCVDSSKAFFDNCDPEKYLRINYEDFTRNPGAHVDELAHFLGIEVTDGLKSAMISGISNRSVGKYTKDMNAAQLDDVKSIVSGSMRTLGYSDEELEANK